MLDIHTVQPVKTDWLAMQITGVSQLKEFNARYPGKLARDGDDWFSAGYDAPIDITDWLVWDPEDQECIAVYTNELFHENMILTGRQH